MDKIEKIKNIKNKTPFKLLDVFLVAILLAASVSLLIFLPQKKGAYIEVYVDGKLIFERPLYEDLDDYKIYTNGGEHYNVIKIEHGYVFVTDSDCGDKTCINLGKTNTQNKSIVCLPHSLKIIVVNSNDDIDIII